MAEAATFFREVTNERQNHISVSSRSRCHRRSCSVPVAGQQRCADGQRTEVVQTACGALAKIDSYDFIASVKAEQDGVAFPDTLTVKASILGNDYQVSFSAGADNTSEGIKVGDKGYVRSTAGGNVWEVSEASLQDVISQLRHLGDSPICPDLSNVTWKAEEELDGEKVTGPHPESWSRWSVSFVG